MIQIIFRTRLQENRLLLTQKTYHSKSSGSNFDEVWCVHHLRDAIKSKRKLSWTAKVKLFKTL